MPRLSRLQIQEFGRFLFAANGGRTLQSKRGKPKGTARRRNKAKHTKGRRTVARVVNKRRNALVRLREFQAKVKYTAEGRTRQSKRGKPKGTVRQRNKAKHTKRRRTVARVVNKRRDALVEILALAMITQNAARSTRSLTRK